MKDSGFYMQEAKKLMENRWKNYAVAYLVYLLIVLGVSFIPVAGTIATFLVAGPFMLAFAMMTMKIIRGGTVEVADAFEGFKNFGNSTILYLHQSLIIFLWSLLLFVPGIIKSFSYSMTFYILSERPEMSSKEAMQESESLMEGHKMELFMLYLRFIGWAFLSVFTCGILMFWLIPYMNLAVGVFYTDLKMLKYGNPNPYSQNANSYSQPNVYNDYMNPGFGAPVQQENQFTANQQTAENTYQASPVTPGYTEPPSQDNQY